LLLHLFVVPALLHCTLHASAPVSLIVRSAGAGEERDVLPDLLRDPGLWKT
jgi:hypothetical protein